MVQKWRGHIEHWQVEVLWYVNFYRLILVQKGTAQLGLMRSGTRILSVQNEEQRSQQLVPENPIPRPISPVVSVVICHLFSSHVLEAGSSGFSARKVAFEKGSAVLQCHQ
jgi:hypothetical protein